MARFLAPFPAAARAALTAAQTRHDTVIAELVAAARPGHPSVITNELRNQLTADVQAAEDELSDARRTARAIPARARLAQTAPDTMVLDTETKLITHAIRMAAYNSESALARLLHAHYPRAEDEGRALLREAFTTAGDIHLGNGTLHMRLNPLSAPRRTRALAALCQELTATRTRYPGTDLVLHYDVKPHPSLHDPSPYVGSPGFLDDVVPGQRLDSQVAPTRPKAANWPLRRRMPPHLTVNRR